ncbi:hypothetical protein IMZ11_16705 [Microtetraspora sp. AC03309]|uniref:hypothetical protein n=1 Tax=Microtetraspora sp. AC03309 TaxID=2779376 RepID=UPI001E5304FF|nr:hypothetical protein [Microtetraspora sp. AC03309]MCC5577267.1 hypothetical protein [Microtetraspora sp. AC03309]
MANGAGTAADVKALSIVGGMVAGADSLDDLDVLRHGGLSRLFGGVRAFHATARLVVRRVKRLNPKSVPEGQPELFSVWRHHVIFTDSPFVLARAEPMHRERRRPPRLHLPCQSAHRHHPPPPDQHPRPDRHRPPPPHPPPARTPALGRRLHRPVDSDRAAHAQLTRATALPAHDPKDIGEPAPDGHPAHRAART